MKLGAGVLVATLVLMGGQAMQAYAYCGFPRALDAHIGIARRNGVDAAEIREILALVDMHPLGPAGMQSIFGKMAGSR